MFIHASIEQLKEASRYETLSKKLQSTAQQDQGGKAEESSRLLRFKWLRRDKCYKSENVRSIVFGQETFSKSSALLLVTLTTLFLGLFSFK